MFLSSCATISYTPRINLDSSTRTIHKSATIEKFVDVSPVADRNNPFTGFSVTNKDAMLYSLDTAITNVVSEDFITNKIFSEARKNIENSDYIIKGKIIKFRGVSALSTQGIIGVSLYFATAVVEIATSQPLVFLSYIPVTTWYFATPARISKVEIELEVSIYDWNENNLGTYTGKSVYKAKASIFKNNAREVPLQTNKVFSDVILQIREQIINDISKYEKQWF